MGPRPFGRGRGTRTARRTDPVTRFNGAATFRSRKELSARACAQIRRRFNGAATFRSRKEHLHLEAGARVRVASMGPRPFGRGRPQTQCTAATPTSSFNGAATFRSRKGRCRRSVAVLGWASMGPRPFGRGRPFSTSIPKSCTAASMGPRPFGRGRKKGFLLLATMTQLQWGRDLSVAEG